MQPHESSLNASRALFGGAPSSADEILSRLLAMAPSADRNTADRETARGVMGAIYRVFDSTLERQLAMKVILDPKGQPVPASKPSAGTIERRFIAEARITGQLNHPGIVPLHEL